MFKLFLLYHTVSFYIIYSPVIFYKIFSILYFFEFSLFCDFFFVHMSMLSTGNWKLVWSGHQSESVRLLSDWWKFLVIVELEASFWWRLSSGGHFAELFGIYLIEIHVQQLDEIIIFLDLSTFYFKCIAFFYW